MAVRDDFAPEDMVGWLQGQNAGVFKYQNAINLIDFTKILRSEIFELSKKQHKFLRRTKQGKIIESELNLDQYIYKIMSAVDKVTFNSFESLNRTTEDSGEINLTRMSFYSVNDNMFTTLMPSMFELNQKLFKHLLEKSEWTKKFIVKYAYLNLPILYLHLIFIVYLAVKTYKMNQACNEALLEIEERDLEEYAQKCSAFTEETLENFAIDSETLPEINKYYKKYITANRSSESEIPKIAMKKGTPLDC